MSKEVTLINIAENYFLVLLACAEACWPAWNIARPGWVPHTSKKQSRSVSAHWSTCSSLSLSLGSCLLALLATSLRIASSETCLVCWVLSMACLSALTTSSCLLRSVHVLFHFKIKSQMPLATSFEANFKQNLFSIEWGCSMYFVNFYNNIIFCCKKGALKKT